MAFTKAQARSLVKQLLDDASSEAWSDSHVDLLLQLTLDDLWGELLQIEPYLRSTLQTDPTLTSPGFIDLSASGPLSGRFYRVQKVTRDNQEYREIDPRDVVLDGNALVAVEQRSGFTYVIFGEQLWLFPLSTAAGIELRYSALPSSFTSLAESATVDFPDGFETVYCYEAAARGLVGKREEAAPLFQLARDSLQRLKAQIEARGPKPLVVFTSTRGSEWGANG